MFSISGILTLENATRFTTGSLLNFLGFIESNPVCRPAACKKFQHCSARASHVLSFESSSMKVKFDSFRISFKLTELQLQKTINRFIFRTTCHFNMDPRIYQQYLGTLPSKTTDKTETYKFLLPIIKPVHYSEPYPT